MNTLSTAPSQIGRTTSYTDTQASTIGTAAHKMLEISLKRYLGTTDAATLFDIQKNEVQPYLPNEYYDIVKRASDFIKGEFESYQLFDPDAKLYPEMWMHYEDLVPDGSGSADAVIITDTNVHIIDLKTGKTPVEPTSNQMKAYATAASLKNPGRDIITTVLQGGEVKSVSHNVADLHQWADEQRAHVVINKSDGYTDPDVKLYYELTMKFRQLPADEITSEHLDVMNDAASAHRTIIKHAKQEAEEKGTTYDGYKYGHGNSYSIDTRDFFDYVESIGKAREALTVMSVTKQDLGKVLTAEESRHVLDNIQVKGKTKNKSLKRVKK